MRIKLECNSCGYAELVSDQTVHYCPQCGSSDLEFITDPLAESETTPKTDLELIKEPEDKSEIDVEPELTPKKPTRRVYTWTQPKPSEKGTAAARRETAQTRLLFGVIGLIMMIGGLVLLFYGVVRGGSSFTGGAITLIVIGIIFLTIGTKGVCCQCITAC